MSFSHATPAPTTRGGDCGKKGDPDGEHRRAPVRFIGTWLGVVFVLATAALPAADLLMLDWSGDRSVRWVHEVWARKMQAANSLSGPPRLLVIGGSSGQFSVDAELLEARLGMPAVNLATHAGLGLRHVIDNADQAARPGDVILLYLEYQMYEEKTLPLNDFAHRTIWSEDPARLLNLPLGELLKEVYYNPLSEYSDGILQRISDVRTPWQPSARWKGYSFVELDPRGDYTGEAVPKKPFTPFSLTTIHAVAPQPGALLQQFFGRCRKRGITVIGAGPGTLEDPAASPEERRRAYGLIVQFYQEQKTPFLDAPELFQLPIDFFADTQYHGNPAGRRVITELLTSKLAPQLKRSAAPAEGPILLLSAHASDRTARETLRSKDAPSQCLLLVAQERGNPLSITPSAARKLASQGKRVLFADPEAGRLLAEAGLESSPVESKEETLAGWLTEYPNHLFALAMLGGAAREPMLEGVPEPYHSFLNRASPCEAALFGSGKLGGVRLLAVGEKEAALECTDHEPWQKGLPFPLTVALRSQAALPMTGSAADLRIGHCAIGENAAGLGAAVIDPVRGIVVRQGRFTARSITVWELREIKAP